MFRITKHGFDLQVVLLMCWINYLDRGEPCYPNVVQHEDQFLLAFAESAFTADCV
jgi:hypothetical protein